jgi:hypothetical protein
VSHHLPRRNGPAHPDYLGAGEAEHAARCDFRFLATDGPGKLRAPFVGFLLRHDHAHLDLVVNGGKLKVPAGVGLAGPVDRGPVPPPHRSDR